MKISQLLFFLALKIVVSVGVQIRGTNLVNANEGSVIEITSGDMWERELAKELPVLVEFMAPWCGSCEMKFPIFEKLADEFEGKVKSYNTSKDYLLDKNDISILPTFQVFKDGKKVLELGEDTYYSDDNLRKLFENAAQLSGS